MNKSFAQLPGYDIGQRLGKGAGAIIYAAVNASTRQRVAIKHVTRRSPEDDKFIAQAETEFEVARRVNHANVRKYYDLVRVRRWLKTSDLYLVMELLDGPRLEDRFDAPPSTFQEVADIFIEISRGLQGIHAAGFVHADMKPNNVILTRDGVKIIDFGQSCEMGTVKERIQGTPDYMAPEQVQRRPLDQRTDIFNLGASMYRVVTGRAFATMMPVGQAGALKIETEGHRANEPPIDINPKTPLTLSKLIMDCCERDKDKRPWDMAAVISRLDTLRHLLARRDASSSSSNSAGNNSG